MKWPASKEEKFKHQLNLRVRGLKCSPDSCFFHAKQTFKLLIALLFHSL